MMDAWEPRLRAARERIAARATDAVLAHHPEVAARRGERALARAREQAAQQVDFLAAALALRAPERYAAYARWTVRMLEARELDRACVEELVREIADAACDELPDEAKALVREYTSRACESARDTHAPPGETSEQGENALADVYLRAALAGDRHTAYGIARAAQAAGWSTRRVYEELFDASQKRLGELWIDDRISVADEHVATACTEYAIARMHEAVLPGGEVRGSLLVTGVEGELHQLGPLLVSDVLELEGWRVTFLGTNVPRPAIIDAVARHRPDVVGLSASMLPRVPETLACIAELRARLGPTAPALVLGGQGFRGLERLASETRALGIATDLAGAIALLAHSP